MMDVKINQIEQRLLELIREVEILREKVEYLEDKIRVEIG